MFDTFSPDSLTFKMRPSLSKLNSVEVEDGDGKIQKFYPKPDPKTLAIGDVVTLNSGSPRMTVLKLHADGKAECTWFESNAPLFSFDSRQSQKYLTLPVSALKKEEPKKEVATLSDLKAVAPMYPGFTRW